METSNRRGALILRNHRVVDDKVSRRFGRSTGL